MIRWWGRQDKLRLYFWALIVAGVVILFISWVKPYWYVPFNRETTPQERIIWGVIAIICMIRWWLIEPIVKAINDLTKAVRKVN